MCGNSRDSFIAKMNCEGIPSQNRHPRGKGLPFLLDALYVAGLKDSQNRRHADLGNREYGQPKNTNCFSVFSNSKGSYLALFQVGDEISLFSGHS